MQLPRFGIGGPNESVESSGGGAAEEEQRVAGGLLPAGGERRQQHDSPEQTHQVAASTVLITIVCRPLTSFTVPVTFTLPSANSTSRPFCGLLGLGLTGM